MADKLSIQVPIRDSVLKQLKHRRDLLIRTDETPLYASELMHNNNKGAWIALASSANSNSTNKLETSTLRLVSILISPSLMKRK